MAKMSHADMYAAAGITVSIIIYLLSRQSSTASVTGGTSTETSTVQTLATDFGLSGSW
jgi:hypothetical protein